MKFVNSLPFLSYKSFFWQYSSSCHIFSKLFQLHTGHGALGKHFQTKGIHIQNHDCECGKLETIEHVLKESLLHPAERDLLRKVSPELGPRILGIKNNLDAVLKFLDLLPQLLCWWFAWLEQSVTVLLSTDIWYWSTWWYIQQVSLSTWNHLWRIRCHRIS